MSVFHTVEDKTPQSTNTERKHAKTFDIQYWIYEFNVGIKSLDLSHGADNQK